MTARPITRAAFISLLSGMAVLLAAPHAHAARNTEAEQYVQSNATQALQTLSDRSVNAAQRQQTFTQLMARFADMPRIATFVLGVHGRQLRADPTLRTEWNRVFQDYAIAVYEDRLDRYRGNAIRVTGSIERVPGRDVIVMSEISPRGQSRPLPVQWRLIRSGEVWKVIDVSLVLEGNEIWLAQQQQLDFLNVLDRNNGDIRALIADVRALTTSMRQRTVARG